MELKILVLLTILKLALSMLDPQVNVDVDVHVQNKGGSSCVCPIACNKKYEPICATNGTTYKTFGNLCCLFAGIKCDPADANMKFLHYGECGCEFGGKTYTSGAFIEGICMRIQCTKGHWNYIGQSVKGCRICTAHGEPHFQPFNKHTYYPPEYANEILYSFQTPGTYVITQPGLGNKAEFRLNSQFITCHQPDLACVKSASYYEPDIEVNMTLPATINCLVANNPDCVITVYVNGKTEVIGNSVRMFDGKDGTILVFQHNHIINSQGGVALNCMNIVGTKGVSVSLCTYAGDYAWLWVFAMPSLENQVYGLCDAFNDTTLNGYTKRDGSVVKGETQDEINEFADSWVEIPGNTVGKRSTSGDRCKNETVHIEIVFLCNFLTIDLCEELPPLCKAFRATCVFDLCRVSNPYRYGQGYASHMVALRHVTSDACCGLWPYPKPCCIFRPSCCLLQ